MGTKLPFCILRGTTFYWRRRLPSPFKMSVEFSLGTKDLRVARGLSSMLTIETDRAYSVLREGKMTPEQVETFARQKFAEHSAKLSAVHQLGRDLKSPWQEEVIATRAAAIAMSILAQHGRSAQLSDFPGLLDGELDAGMTQQAQTLLDVYRLDYWSDVRAKRLQLDLAENLSLRNPSSLDLAQARSATLEAYAAAGAAMAAKFGATPKSLEDLAALAARFSEPQEHSQDIQVSEALTERSHATGVTSPPSHCTETAETGFRTAVADKKHTVASDDSMQAGDDIIAFAEAAASFDVERKNIRASTARQKLQVFTLFIAATGKSTFQTLHQTDIKKFVDVMALLPKVRGRSAVDRELGVADLIAKGRTLPKNEVGLTAATVNRNLSYLTKLIRQAGMAGLEGIPDLKM